MTAEEFIFKSPPYRKITGDDFQELYDELNTDGLSVSGFNPVSNVESTYHMLGCSIGVGKGPFHDQSNVFITIEQPKLIRNIRV